MPLDNPQGGIGYAAEFQSAALPWITSSIAPTQGSPARWDFPYVTRFINVVNLGTGTMSIGATWSGVANTNNKVFIPVNSSLTFEWRVSSIFVQGESGNPQYSLAVGLTTIPSRNMPQLSGTLDSGLAGWQGVG